MTFQQFFLALRYRWRTAVAVWLASLVGILLIASLLMPVRYRAAAELLIEEENLDPIAGVALPGSNMPSRVMTEADVVHSERVLLRALDSMEPRWRDELRQRWETRAGGQGDFKAWVAQELKRATEVRPARDSRVLSVTHSSSDPRFAAAFVNALTKAYIETAIEIRLEPARQYNAFFEERATHLRERLFEAQKRASEFQRRHGIATVDDKLDVEAARLNDLSAQVVTLQAKAGEAQRRQSEAAAGPDRMEEVLKDPTVAALAGALSLQEAKQAELMERLGTAHPQAIEAGALTAGLAERLQAAKRRVASAFEGGSRVLTAQLAERTRALEAQREKVLKHNALRDEARLLQNEVEVARKSFEAVIDRLNKTTLEKSAPQVNVSILKAAAVPSLATSASGAARLAVGAVIGLVLALVAVVVAEVRDRRLRHRNDVLQVLDQPVLAVLRPRKPRGTRSIARPILVQPRTALTSE